MYIQSFLFNFNKEDMCQAITAVTSIPQNSPSTCNTKNNTIIVWGEFAKNSLQRILNLNNIVYVIQN